MANNLCLNAICSDEWDVNPTVECEHQLIQHMLDIYNDGKPFTTQLSPPLSPNPSLCEDYVNQYITDSNQTKSHENHVLIDNDDHIDFEIEALYIEQSLDEEIIENHSENTEQSIINDNSLNSIDNSIEHNNNKKRKVGRYSLEQKLGLNDSEIRDRIREQNRCAQQRKRDKIKANKQQYNNEQMTTSREHQRVSQQQPQREQITCNENPIGMTSSQIHIYLNALEKSLIATSIDEKHDLIDFVLSNFKLLLNNN